MSEKSLEMRHFQDFVRLEEPGAAPSWAALSRSGCEKMKIVQLAGSKDGGLV